MGHNSELPSLVVLCGHNFGRKMFIQYHDRHVRGGKESWEENAEIRQESRAENKVQLQVAKGETRWRSKPKGQYDD